MEELVLPGDERGFPTVAALPLYVLKNDDTFEDWEFSSEEEFQPHVEPILHDIDTVGEAFWQRHSTIDDVRATLENSDWGHHVILSSEEERIRLMAAILVVRGHVDQAIDMLQQALDERKGQRIKYTYDLMKMLERVRLLQPGG